MNYNAIAIAGLPKSGKTALINELLKYFSKWRTYSIGELLRERHARWKKQNNFDFNFEKYYREIVTDKDIIQVNKKARELLKKGEVILDSRFAKINSQNLDNVLLVFLKAPLKIRAERAKQAYPENTINEIESILKQREQDEKNRGEKIFNFTYNDESNYPSGLIIDSSKNAINEEVDLILKKFNSKKLITISGQPGAGSTTLGKLISQKLSLDYFSPGQLYKDIAKGKIKEQHYFQEFKKLCEENDFIIPDLKVEKSSEAAIALWNIDFEQSKKLHHIIDILQKRIASKRGIIIDGKISLRMIPNSDFRIWLKASAKERARRISTREALSAEKSEKILSQREKKEREEWEKIYGFDYFTQEEDADIVIDTSDKIPEEILFLAIKEINNKL